MLEGMPGAIRVDNQLYCPAHLGPQEIEDASSGRKQGLFEFYNNTRCGLVGSSKFRAQTPSLLGVVCAGVVVIARLILNDPLCSSTEDACLWRSCGFYTAVDCCWC